MSLNNKRKSTLPPPDLPHLWEEPLLAQAVWGMPLRLLQTWIQMLSYK